MPLVAQIATEFGAFWKSEAALHTCKKLEEGCFLQKTTSSGVPTRLYLRKEKTVQSNKGGKGYERH